jgi:6-phosphogluconolactonase
MPTYHLIKRHYFNTMSALANALTQSATAILRATLDKNDKASLAIPGGRTPSAYLPRLGQQNLPWQRIFVTISDERWVDTTQEDSNERLIREYFLQYTQTPPHFISLKTTHTHPDQAIENINVRLSKLPLPFNLIILGLGEDGHIASLFPGMTLDPDATDLCQAALPPAAPSSRISLSFRTLIDSDRIILAITGAKKRKLLDQLVESPDPNIPLAKLIQYKSVESFETD